ncbi:MAG: hypothetical protein AB2805_08130, partial [Candidatus Thiodiazotropha sp.]
TCTQCMQCIAACDATQQAASGSGLLKMLEDQCALDVSTRDFGFKPEVPEACFSKENAGKRKCCH